MSKRKIALKVLVLVAGLFLMSTSNVWADGICQADMDYDGKVFPSDAMIFLNEWKRKDCAPNGPAPVPKTGQSTPYYWLDDGWYQKGVAWPNPRFTDNRDETVTDNLTGLMWTKNAQQILGYKTWSEAITACNDLDYAGYTDWRLPNVRELQSLIDHGKGNPALPLGHPFTSILNVDYWSSTTYFLNSGLAWYVYMIIGKVDIKVKSSDNSCCVWPVRGGCCDD